MLILFAEPVQPGVVKALARRLGQLYTKLPTGDHLAPRNIDPFPATVARCHGMIIPQLKRSGRLDNRLRKEFGNISAFGLGSTDGFYIEYIRGTK